MRRLKRRQISDEEMTEISKNPIIPFGFGLMDGMRKAEERKQSGDDLMFGDGVFGNMDNMPEKWTSNKRGIRYKKAVRKKFKVL